MQPTYQGRCLCGAVQFLASGAPKWVLWCHCESCRRHSGAPASVFVSFADDSVSMTSGEITKYESSPGVERGFLRALRLDADMRQSETAERDALPYRRVRARCGLGAVGRILQQ